MFADDNFKLDENSKNFSKRIENNVEKGEIARYKQFLLFPQRFSEDLNCRHVKTRAYLKNGLNNHQKEWTYVNVFTQAVCQKFLIMVICELIPG